MRKTAAALIQTEQISPEPMSAPAMTAVTFHGLLGWLHQAGGPMADTGVVLISPLGRDARCGHLPMRLFADQLAEAGFPTLRYDHRGEGDSLPCDDPEADAFEKHRLLDALEAARGNKSEAARLLGMPRSTFFSKLKKHGLAVRG